MLISHPAVPVNTGAAPLSATRLAFLDMTKGILVILMVVYHSLNYTSQYDLAFRYLSFLPPSFILITGFLISVVYFPRYRTGDSSIRNRLLSRGLKLLLLFISLNILAQYVRSPVYGYSVGVAGFFQRWHEIFVVGAGAAAAFEVLLPIAYLLLLAPALLWLADSHPLLFPGVTAALVTTCILFGMQGMSYSNLNLLSAGLVGMLAGRALPTPDLLGRPLATAAIAYAIYFPLSLSKGYIYLIQLAGAGIALVLICSISLRMGDRGRWQQFMIRNGKYSLLSYIAQIAVLQILSRVIGRPQPISPESSLLLSGTLLLTLGLIEATDWLRRRSSVIDRLYRLVFA